MADDTRRSNDDQRQDSGDSYLIDEIRGGSSIAFKQLVDRFSGRLRAFASRQMSGSGLDPDDAVQETFLSLVRNIQKLPEVRSLQAYLFTILRCRIADLARARGPTAGAVSLEAVEASVGFEPTSPGETPSTYARQGEAMEARPLVLVETLDSLLSRLKSQRKFRDLKILELLFSVGVNNKEAAKLADTSEPTVSRTRASLIEELQKIISSHPKADALEDLPGGHDVSTLVRNLWSENLFSCIKRSTLGHYALGVLDDDDWLDYVKFHLDVVACDVCLAHLEDLQDEDASASIAARERFFASSVGFLKR